MPRPNQAYWRFVQASGTNHGPRDHLCRFRSRSPHWSYQGSDPTQPYPTLVIRQSATLLPRLFALDMNDVVRSFGRIVTLWDQAPLTRSMVANPPPSSPRPRGESRPRGTDRSPASTASAPVPRPAGPPPTDIPIGEVGPPPTRKFQGQMHIQDCDYSET